MTPFLIVQTALSSLSTNKLRAGLTLLGIIIGVAAVIASIAIGRGSQEQVSDQIEALGTNLLFVQSNQGGDATLTLSDASALAKRELLPSVREVASRHPQRRLDRGGDRLHVRSDHGRDLELRRGPQLRSAVGRVHLAGPRHQQRRGRRARLVGGRGPVRQPRSRGRPGACCRPPVQSHWRPGKQGRQRLRDRRPAGDGADHDGVLPALRAAHGAGRGDGHQQSTCR